jgi:adenylate cyclase
MRLVPWLRFSPTLTGLALLAAFLALRVVNPPAVGQLRNLTFDTFQRWKPRIETKFPVRVVDIDEKSLEEIGQWPWPRDVLADLITRLGEAGAVTVAFDALFAEPDRLSPDRIAQSLPGLDDATRAALAAQPSNEQLMANAMLRVRVVLGEVGGPALRPDASKRSSRIAVVGTGRNPIGVLTGYPAVITNRPEIDAVAAGRGLFAFEAERDGVVRRVPAALAVGSVMMPSLSVETLRVATNTPTILLRNDAAGIESVTIAGIVLPTDRRAHMWLHFTPHLPARYLSAADVLAKRVPADAVRGRLVIIGASAAGLFDRRATPLEAAMPGAEIHAQALENMLGGSLLTRPHNVAGPELLIVLVTGLGIILAVPRLGSLRVLLLGLSVLGALWGGAWYLFASHRLLIDPSFATVSSLVVFAALAFTNYAREEKQRSQIRNAFARYVSPSLVEQIVRQPDRLKLGGETRELTVLFSDVRGFTGLAEQFRNDPQGLTAFMNRLLTPLTTAILDQRGTVDKYMGDAVLAFWNAPLDDAGHAGHACLSALEMLARVDQLNAGRRTEAEASGIPFKPVVIGIGINTGTCTVGNMGSDLRFDYSVLGDSVNVASRLEDLTKAYGVSALAGCETARQAAGVVAMLPIDVVRVKGKSEPEEMYVILGARTLVDDPGFQSLSAAWGALRASYRAQDWTACGAHVAACRQADTASRLAGPLAHYESRLQRIADGFVLPADWDGVWTLEDKDRV